jgi:hypothetical protein
MDAARGFSTSKQFANSTIPLALVRLVALRTFCGLLAFVAFILLARRFAGALVEPLATTSLLCVALAAIFAAIVVKLLNANSDPRFFSLLSEGLELFIAAVALLVIAGCLSIGGSSLIGLTVLWLATLVAGGVLVKPWSFEPAADPLQGFSLVTREAAAVDVWPPPDDVRTVLPTAEETANEWDDRAVTQRIDYRTSETGMLVDGWLRVEFAPGQRVAFAHVSFCPAFAHAPIAEAEIMDGPMCEIRPTLVLPWGIRWDVRLDAEASEATEVVLAFAASEKQEREGV